MTLPLTLEQTRPVVEALRRDGHAWVAVECVCVPYWPKGHPEHVCSCVGRWAEAAAAVCETCDGDGCASIQEWGEVTVRQCQGCVQGKPIHTLSVECGKCNYGVRNTGRGEPGPHECPECGSVDAIVAELVEVKPWQSTTTTERGRWIAVSESGTIAVQECDGVSLTTHPAITVIGSPQPGDWVAHLEAVT